MESDEDELPPILTRERYDYFDLERNNGRVSEEVLALLGNAIFPTLRSADTLNQSLWNRPLILYHSRTASKLLKTEEYFTKLVEAAQPKPPPEEILTVTLE